MTLNTGENSARDELRTAHPAAVPGGLGAQPPVQVSFSARFIGATNLSRADGRQRLPRPDSIGTRNDTGVCGGLGAGPTAVLRPPFPEILHFVQNDRELSE